MMKKLGTPQHILWLRYLDCKERTKKKVGLPINETIISDDETLIHFLLENSSIVERNNERAFSSVGDAINLICKQLCPGQWCTRSHCKHHNSRYAYYCTKTRPSVCKDFKKYIAGIEERKKKNSQNEGL